MKLEAVDSGRSVNRMHVHVGIVNDMQDYNEFIYYTASDRPIPFTIGQPVRLTLSDQDAI